MRDIADFRSLPSEECCAVIRRLRTDIRKLESIKRESDSPDETVAKFRKAVGPKRAAAVIASVVNAYEDDGRICRASTDWSHRVETAWSHGFMHEKCIYTEIHPAHIDQIAMAARNGGDAM